MSEFRDELRSLLNKHSMEGGSNTPDFILADFLVGCLRQFDAAVNHRELWYGRTIPTPENAIVKGRLITDEDDLPDVPEVAADVWGRPSE